MPVVPFALALVTTENHRWLRLASTTVAGALSLAWLWRRHRPEFRAFFSAVKPV